MIDFNALVVGPCIATFGEAVTFMPQAGAPAPITAVFTERATQTSYSDGVEVVEERTMLGCQESQFNGQVPVENDQFVARNILWRAAEVKRDGHGHIAIVIMLASDAQANQPLVPAFG